MKRAFLRPMSCAAAMIVSGVWLVAAEANLSSAPAVVSPVPAPAVVELPPMVVEQAATLPPWLYVRSDDIECLSRCSEAITRDYVQMRRNRTHWLHTLFPAEFFMRMDAPVVTVLMSQRFKPTANAEMIDALMKSRDRPTDVGSYSRATTAPNMALTDMDRAGVFVYIDTAEFDRNKLTIATDYVRFLLEGRTPALPAWLQEGIVAVYNDVEFQESPITLRPLRWLSSVETFTLVKDPLAPRTLLSAVDLFSDGVRGERGPTHAARARAQCGLLVRWAIDPANGVRDAFWRFAARACSEPVTESMFEACFGFGFSDLRDRLSDYLPRAVKSPLKVPMSRSPGGTIEVRRATPTEIARVRGEWERLSVPFVRHRFPDHVVRYVEQARRTLQRAYDAGDRDPQLLATLGLCELEASNDALARELLEAATAQGVARPRAYYELARLRWVELVRGQPSTREFDATEIAPIVATLHHGLDQAPVLIDAVQLLADATFRSTSPPSDEGVKRLVELGRRFVSESRVCLRVARALSRHGKRDEAVALLGAGFLYVRDEATRVQFAQLYSAMAPASGR